MSVLRKLPKHIVWIAVIVSGLCCGLFCRRQLHIYDQNNVQYGIADSPCECCGNDGFKINVQVPEDVIKMQVRETWILLATCYYAHTDQ